MGNHNIMSLLVAAALLVSTGVVAAEPLTIQEQGSFAVEHADRVLLLIDDQERTIREDDDQRNFRLLAMSKDGRQGPIRYRRDDKEGRLARQIPL